MEFHPSRLLGTAFGAVIVIVLLGMVGLLGYNLGHSTPSLAFFLGGLLLLLLLLPTILFGFWTYACWRLSFHLDRNALTIHWGLTKQHIPISSIKGLLRGHEVEEKIGVQGINWPGYHVGRSRLPGFGETLFYSTHRQAGEILYVVTPALTYAISPPEPEHFALELGMRRRLGAIERVRQACQRHPILSLPFWWDRPAQAMALLALLLNAILFAYIFYLYPSLPEFMPLHFNPLGEVERVGQRSELLLLPTMALGILGGNLLLSIIIHARERLAGYLCLTATPLVQAILWLAILKIIP